MTDLTITCKSRLGNFITESTSELFLCKDGLKEHWNIPPGTKKIEVRLHDEKPSLNAHKFTTLGVFGSGIKISPDKGEDWDSKAHGTYSRFGQFLSQYKREARNLTGWMEISILG